MRTATTAFCLLASAALGLVGCQHIGREAIPARRDRIDSTASVKPVAAKVQPASDHYQAARAAFMDGNTAKADLEVKLALQENPLDAKSHFLLGCLLEQQG